MRLCRALNAPAGASASPIEDGGASATSEQKRATASQKPVVLKANKNSFLKGTGKGLPAPKKQKTVWYGCKKVECCVWKSQCTSTSKSTIVRGCVVSHLHEHAGVGKGVLRAHACLCKHVLMHVCMREWVHEGVRVRALRHAGRGARACM
eukprot:350576-Chlamydomonas_euryale.AAC.7